MEHRYLKVPFKVELAKRIANGKLDGKIITRDGKDVRILCFDRKTGGDSHIVALVGIEEEIETYMLDGMWMKAGVNSLDLMLEVPEYITFKDGDIVKLSNENYTWISVIKNIYLTTDDRKGQLFYFTNDYVSMLINDGDGDVDIDTYSDAGIYVENATEEEKQQLINALKASKEPKAKEYLKRFFGVEEYNKTVKALRQEIKDSKAKMPT